MSYTVKSLPGQTILAQYQVNDQAIGLMTGQHNCFAVVDQDGKIAKSTSGQFEIYRRKATAQQVADFYNSK